MLWYINKMRCKSHKLNLRGGSKKKSNQISVSNALEKRSSKLAMHTTFVFLHREVKLISQQFL